MVSDRESLRVRKIRNGTVIDHITAGNSLAVLRILGIVGRERHVVSVLMNVPSETLGRKDIVKIEGRELSPTEVDEIALVAPQATINIIRSFEVVSKKRVKLPKIIKGLLRCINPLCVSNSNEPVKTQFLVESESPLRLKCYFCSSLLEIGDVIKQF